MRYTAQQATIPEYAHDRLPAGWWVVREDAGVIRTFGGQHPELEARAYAADLNRAHEAGVAYGRTLKARIGRSIAELGGRARAAVGRLRAKAKA